jgi:hypothetical protein
MFGRKFSSRPCLLRSCACVGSPFGMKELGKVFHDSLCLFHSFGSFGCVREHMRGKRA